MAYHKAPITEALIDIRADLPETAGFQSLLEIKQRVEKDYPRVEIRGITEIKSTFSPDPKTVTEQKQLGYALFSTDGRQVFQARVDGFTFSRLQPYDSWDALRAEARRLWDIYRELLQPKKITRVAVRFINQLNLPGAEVEPDDYLNTFVQISTKLPHELRLIGQFIMSLRMFQKDLNGWMVVNETLGPPKIPNTVAIILDLDLYVESPVVADETALWDLFDRLRERKNVYFEACITDRTRELIR